jgi:outer membrane protein, heavy metal efflux system
VTALRRAPVFLLRTPRYSPYVAWILLALAGCATYQEKPLDPVATQASLEARRLDDAGLAAFLARSGAVAGEAWDFPKLVLAALYYNPEIEVARAQLRVSEAGIVTAGKRPNPDMDAAAGRATNPPSGEPAGLADIQLAFPFETADKRRHRMAQAEQLAESARLAMAATAWKVRGKVRDAMLDADAAAAESEILAGQVRVQESISAMLGRRVELGAASSLEQVQTGAALAQARLDAAAARARAAQARSRLAAAIGVPGQALDGVAISFRALEPPEPQLDNTALTRAALSARSDLQVALAQHAAADAALRLEIAKQWPDVQLAPAYSYDTGTNKFTFGVVRLALPLFDRNEGPIAEAEARRDEAAARFESLQASVLAQVGEALQAVAAAHAEREQASALERRARAQWTSTERRFQAEADDRLALASAQSALETARIALARARHDAQRSIAQLEDATQQPFFDPVSPAFAESPAGAKP